MPLDHDRAARCKRRSGIAPDRGESERKIGGAKNRDRANRTLHHPNLGPRQGLAVWQCRVTTLIQISALTDMLREQAQLPCGAPTLTLQTGLWQAGFLAANFGDGFGAGVNFLGNRLQKAGASVA